MGLRVLSPYQLSVGVIGKTNIMKLLIERYLTLQRIIGSLMLEGTSVGR